MSYIFVLKSFNNRNHFICLKCNGKFVKIIKVSVCPRNNAGKDLSSWFCEDCFKEMFSYDNERKQLKQGIYTVKDDFLDNLEKGNVECNDDHCGSYAECDKIHCHQFYEYTNKGIVRRE